MLKIEITYDGDDVVVHQQELDADAEKLVHLIARWTTVADEPCVHGHKCDAVKKMLLELGEILGGYRKKGQ